jgi:hypothetical protein
MDYEVNWQRIGAEVRAKYENQAWSSLITLSRRGEPTFTALEVFDDMELANDYAKAAVDAVLRQAQRAGQIVPGEGTGVWTVVKSVWPPR